MKEKREKLFTEFPPVSTEEWMENVTADLKGVPFEKKLVWRTKEGFELMPFYREEDIKDLPLLGTLPGEYPYVRGTKTHNIWLVRQEIIVRDHLSQINEKIKNLMEHGVTAVGLHFEDDQVSAAAVQEVLEGIDLSKLEVNFYSCVRHVVRMAEAVVEAFDKMGVAPESVQGSINYNPFRRLMIRGERWTPWKETGVELLKAVAPLKNFTCFTVQSIDFVNAGAYIYQELGYALAAGAEILSTFSKESGCSVAEVAKRTRFDMGVGSNYFIEMAKFRAVRWLWAMIVKANDGNAPEESLKATVHVENSMWNKTVYDSYVNLLRTQTETMSAAIAGVHSMTVVPFDVAYEEEYSDFGERIARNQQLLLLEESHFDKVVDPAGGSYYVEHLTDAIGKQAWKLFLEVEEQGGFYALANEGVIQEKINASNDERHKAVATRRENLLGTNIFPNFTEKAGEEKIVGKKDLTRKQVDVTPLDFRRGGSDFEALRMSTEQKGNAPKVFMLTIGNLAMRLARSQFSSNFFACAGYQLIDNLGFESVEEGVNAAIAADADLVVLCSSDDEYAEYGPQALDALAGRIPLVIAGAPKCMDELKEKGIEHFIHVKVNVLETLQMFNQLLGVQAK